MQETGGREGGREGVSCLYTALNETVASSAGLMEEQLKRNMEEKNSNAEPEVSVCLPLHSLPALPLFIF